MDKMIKNMTTLAPTLVVFIFFAAPIHASKPDEDKKSFGYSNRYGVVTPTQVYSLMENINSVTTHYVKNYGKKNATAALAVKLKPVSGKSPDDAFVVLHRLSNVIDNLTKAKEPQTIKRVKRSGAKVLPAEVFLQAGHSLDALISYMNTLAPEKNWGDYYVVNEYKTSKKPNDVYAIADLNVRKLNAVMGK